MSAKLTDPREVFLLASFKDYRASVGCNLSDKMWMECARQALAAWEDYRKERKQARAKRIKKFTKPTGEEVQVYSFEIGWPLDGEAWVLSYAQKGWMIGKSPMVNWKLAVQTWKRNKWHTVNTPLKPEGKAAIDNTEPEGWRKLMQDEWSRSGDDWYRTAAACTWENMPRHWKPKIIEICQQQKQPTETRP
jgi:hypothetical protein